MHDSNKPSDAPYVFVSYSTEDTDWCERIVDALTEAGIRVERCDDLLPGQRWHPGLYAQMLGASAACCLISSAYESSMYCAEEAKQLLDLEIPVIPIIVREVDEDELAWWRAIHSVGTARSPLDRLRDGAAARQIRRAVKAVSRAVRLGALQRHARDPPARVVLDRVSSHGSRCSGRRSELDRIGRAWCTGRTRVLVLSGPAGAGKSTLMRAWVDEMSGADYLGAGVVVTWSLKQDGDGKELVREALGALDVVTPVGAHASEVERLARALESIRGFVWIDDADLGAGSDGAIDDPTVRYLARRLGELKRGLLVLTVRARGSIADTISRCDALEVGPLSIRAARDVLPRPDDTSIDSETRLAQWIWDCPMHVLGVLSGLESAPEDDEPRWMSVARACPSPDGHRFDFEAAVRSIAGGLDGLQSEIVRALALVEVPLAATEIGDVLGHAAATGGSDSDSELVDALASLVRRGLVSRLTIAGEDHVQLQPGLQPWIVDVDGGGDAVQALFEWLCSRVARSTDAQGRLRAAFDVVPIAIRGSLQQRWMNDVYKPAIEGRAGGYEGFYETAPFGRAASVMSRLVSSVEGKDDSMDRGTRAKAEQALAFCLEAHGQMLPALDACRRSVESSNRSIPLGQLATHLEAQARIELTIGEPKHAAAHASEAFRSASESIGSAISSIDPHGGARCRHMQCASLATMGDALLHLGETYDGLRAFDEAKIFSDVTNGPSQRFLMSHAGFREGWWAIELGRIDHARMMADVFERCRNKDALGRLDGPLTIGFEELVHARVLVANATMSGSSPSRSAFDRLASAEANLERGGRWAELHYVAVVRSELAVVEGEFERALEIVDASARIAAESSARLMELRLRLESGRVHSRWGRREEAISALESVEREATLADLRFLAWLARRVIAGLES